MVKLKDGQPLISTALALTIAGALVAPSLGGVLWLRGWVSTADEKLTTLVASQAKIEAMAYPRNVAEAEIRRLDGVTTDLKARIGEASAQLQVLNQRSSYPSDRRSDVMRSLKAAVEPDQHLFRPQ